MIKAWGITHKGCVRPQNQDTYYLDVLSEDLAVGLVCDGMGGARAGNIASMLAVEAFVEALQDLPPGTPEEDPEALLARAAAKSVLPPGAAAGACHGMGTTMVAALVLSDMAYLLNIGDSRAYYISGNGIEKVTRDHSLVEDMVRRGDITPEQARNHPQKNLITRALGTEEHVRADFYRKNWKAGTRFFCARTDFPTWSAIRRCSMRYPWRSGGRMLPPAFGHRVIPGRAR